MVAPTSKMFPSARPGGNLMGFDPDMPGPGGPGGLGGPLGAGCLGGGPLGGPPSWNRPPQPLRPAMGLPKEPGGIWVSGPASGGTALRPALRPGFQPEPPPGMPSMFGIGRPPAPPPAGLPPVPGAGGDDIGDALMQALSGLNPRPPPPQGLPSWLSKAGPPSLSELRPAIPPLGGTSGSPGLGPGAPPPPASGFPNILPPPALPGGMPPLIPGLPLGMPPPPSDMPVPKRAGGFRGDGMCGDFLRGVCHRGDTCKFSHGNRTAGDTGDAAPQVAPPPGLAGRPMDDNPHSTICRFGRKCKRNGCFFFHPQGREVDDDPSKGMCRQGINCRRPDCLYSHPPGREPVGNELRECHICGERGHLMRDCPRTRKGAVRGQHVTMTDFPREWLAMPSDKLSSQIAVELEVFGPLSLQPTVLDHGMKAVAAFIDNDNAKSAVAALGDSKLFSIELCEPPAELYPKEAPMTPGAVLIRDFPSRWTSTDVSALLHGVVKPSTLMGIDMLDKEEGSGGAARVRFRDCGAARDAAKELRGQKVAGRPLSIALETEDGLENADEVKGEEEKLSEQKRGLSPRSRLMDDVEMCNDFKRGLCNRGSRCKFSHGLEKTRERSPGPAIEDSKEEKPQGEGDNEAGRQRSRSRSRSPKGKELAERQEQPAREKPRVAVVHIDELPMPQRPEVDPASTDREVFVDPLPEEDVLDTCINAFGTAEEVFKVPGSRRCGYVKFKEHAAALRSVEAGFGNWSESERTLSSQRSRRAQDGTISTYPDSIIARLVGTGGEAIRKLQQECGANWLHLRGEDLGHSDQKFSSSQRVHFIAEGDEPALAKMKEVLERRLAEIHEAIKERLKEDAAKKGEREAEGPEAKRPRGGGDADRGALVPSSDSAGVWRPPGADRAGPPHMAPPGPWGPWPMGPGYMPPPGMMPPGAFPGPPPGLPPGGDSGGNKPWCPPGFPPDGMPPGGAPGMWPGMPPPGWPGYPPPGARGPPGGRPPAPGGGGSRSPERRRRRSRERHHNKDRDKEDRGRRRRGGGDGGSPGSRSGSRKGKKRRRRED